MVLERLQQRLLGNLGSNGYPMCGALAADTGLASEGRYCLQSEESVPAFNNAGHGANGRPSLGLLATTPHQLADPT